MAEGESKGLLTGLSLPSPRSAALSSLLWLLGILMTGTVGSVKAGAASWVTGLLGGLVAVAFAQFLLTYNYLLIWKPDALGTTPADVQMLETRAKYGLLGDTQRGPVTSPQPPVTPEGQKNA